MARDLRAPACRHGVLCTTAGEMIAPAAEVLYMRHARVSSLLAGDTHSLTCMGHPPAPKPERWAGGMPHMNWWWGTLGLGVKHPGMGVSTRGSMTENRGTAWDCSSLSLPARTLMGDGASG